MIAMMICLGFLPFALSLSPNSLRRGLKVRAFMAGIKRARRRLAEPTLVIGVDVRPEVPLTKCEGVTPAQAASCLAF